jgi:hypothetical protein
MCAHSTDRNSLVSAVSAAELVGGAPVLTDPSQIRFSQIQLVRSIKLEELPYPAADEAVQTPEHIHAGGKAGKPVGIGAFTKSSRCFPLHLI